MFPTLNGSSAIRHFKHSDAIEIHNGITFDFYTVLPHIRVMCGIKIPLQDFALKMQRGRAYAQEGAYLWDTTVHAYTLSHTLYIYHTHTLSTYTTHTHSPHIPHTHTCTCTLPQFNEMTVNPMWDQKLKTNRLEYAEVLASLSSPVSHEFCTVVMRMEHTVS